MVVVFLLVGFVLSLVGMVGVLGMFFGELGSRWEPWFAVMAIVGWSGMLIVGMSWAIWS